MSSRRVQRPVNVPGFSKEPVRPRSALRPSRAADPTVQPTHPTTNSTNASANPSSTMGIFQRPQLKSGNGKRKRELPEGLWQKCKGCGEVIHNLEITQNLRV